MCHHHVPRSVCLRYRPYHTSATGNQTTRHDSVPIVDITVEAKPDKRVSGGSHRCRTIVKQISLPSQWPDSKKYHRASRKRVRRRASRRPLVRTRWRSSLGLDWLSDNVVHRNSLDFHEDTVGLHRYLVLGARGIHLPILLNHAIGVWTYRVELRKETWGANAYNDWFSKGALSRVYQVHVPRWP